ncbi:hypothetical protein ACTFIW_010439 [Dictyostelium discoideum]
MPNPIPISIPEGPKSDCITKEVQDLLLDDAIEQVLPNLYSKRVFYSNAFTVPKPGTTLHRPVLDLKRLNTYINNQSFKMEGIKNLPSMVKQGYYMVKLDIKKAYLHVLVDPQYRDLFRFVWKGSHCRWKTMPFGLSTAPRIFTMLSRPVIRMMRDINISVIAYLDDLLIVGSTKEEYNGLTCQTRFQVKSIIQLNMSSNRREMIELLMAYQALFIQSNQELQLATEERNVQSNPTSVRSYPDGSVHISPKSSNEQLLNNQNECIQPRLESTEAMSGHPTTHSFAFYPGENELIKFEEGFYILIFPIWRSATWYPMIQEQVPRHHRHISPHTAEFLMKSWKSSTLNVYSSSYTRFRNFCTSNSLNPANITLFVFMDYLTHLFKHKPPLAFSTINGHQEASLIPNRFAIRENELIQFEEGFYNTDLPNLEISNLVSDDSSTSSSSSSSHVSSSSGNIPRSIDQTISRVNTNPNLTTLETWDYSSFQSHVMSIIPFSKINRNNSMLNQLLLLRNQTDIVNDPFITRIMTSIHKLGPSSVKCQKI